MGTYKQKCDVTSSQILKKENDVVVQQYVKFVDKFIAFSYNTEKLDKFRISNKFSEFALVVINNRMGVDVKEIFFNISNIIMKSTDSDNPLFSMTVKLNNLSFSDVKMGRNPATNKSLISNNCKVLNEVSYDLARFILSPRFLNMKKELTDILQDFISAIDRVDVRIESQSTYHSANAWMEFYQKERNFANKWLYKQYVNCTQEFTPDLHLRTMVEVARDIIHMFNNLINYLQKMIYIFKKVYQLVLREMINNINEDIINLELSLRNPKLDGRKLIDKFMRNSGSCILKSLQYHLIEKNFYHQDDEHMRELTHYVVTEYIVICRRLARRVGF